MSKKVAQPALYEKMRTRLASAEPASSVTEPKPHAPHFDMRAAWLTASRSVRLPMGYLFLAIAVALALVWVSYMIGFNRGDAAARSDVARELGNGFASPATDPLTLEPLDATVADTAKAAKPAANRVSGNQRNWPAAWGPVVPPADPRTKGYQYYIIMDATPESGAARVAEFCRANGLETYVLRRKNDRNCRVIVFPGFLPKDRNSREILELEQKIKSVGLKWKSAERNAGDFHECYPLPEYEG